MAIQLAKADLIVILPGNEIFEVFMHKKLGHLRFKISLVLVIFGLLLASTVHSVEYVDCDLDLNNHYGPYDFYDLKNQQEHKISIVTDYHLTQNMLQLRKGATTSISGDLAYALNAIPNHPQALDLASRLQKAIVSGRMGPDERLRRSVDCYFMRAVKLNPRIGETYYVWALHFQRNKKLDRSAEMYRKAEELGMSTPEFYYNYGLLLFSQGKYELAKSYAAKAYASGFPLEGLKSKLKSKGY